MAEWDLSGDLEKDLATAKLMALQQAAAAPTPPASPLTPTPGEPGSGQTIESKVGFDPFKDASVLHGPSHWAWPAQTALSILTNKAIPGEGYAAGLGRMGAQAAEGGAFPLLQGGSPADVALGTALGLTGQGLGEMTGATAGPLMRQSAGRRIEAGNSAAQDAWEALNASAKDRMAQAKVAYQTAAEPITRANLLLREQFLRDKAAVAARNAAAETGFLREGERVGAANVAGKSAYQQAAAMHAENAASKMTDYLRGTVEDLADMPGGTRGLLDIVYGRGQKKLSAGFDAVEKDLLSQAKGQTIDISSDAAAKFGLKPTVPNLTANQMAALKASGARMDDPKSMADAMEQLGIKATAPGGYDAAQAIKAIKGQYKTDEYHEVMDALREAGLTNPKAEGYSRAQAYINFLDKTNALEGEQLRPDRVLKGFTRLSKINELRRRNNEGNIFEGEIQAVRGGPEPFTETSMPRRPISEEMPMRPPLGVRPPKPEAEALPSKPIPVSVESRQYPWYVRHIPAGIAGAVAGAGAHAAGMGPLGAAIGSGIASGGTALGTEALTHGGKWYIKAPLSARQEEIQRLIPIFLGGMGSATMREPQRQSFLGQME